MSGLRAMIFLDSNKPAPQSRSIAQCAAWGAAKFVNDSGLNLIHNLNGL